MDRKQLIIETTLKLITQQGFHASPMAQIATEAGVAAGTIYHHFEDKTDLIRQVFKHVKQEMGECLAQNYHSDYDYQKQFVAYWKGLYNFFIQNPIKFRFLEQYHHSPFINEETQQEGKVFYQSVLDFFESGITRGFLRNMDITLLSSLIYGNIATVARLQLSGELNLNNYQLDDVIQSSWDSIRKM